MKQLITTGGTIRAMEMPTEIKTALGRNLFREVFLKKYPESIDTFVKVCYIKIQIVGTIIKIDQKS